MKNASSDGRLTSPPSSPTSAAARSRRRALTRSRSKICRLRMNEAAGPANSDSSCTSASPKPSGLSAATSTPISVPSEIIGASTTDCASGIPTASRSRRGSLSPAFAAYARPDRRPAAAGWSSRTCSRRARASSSKSPCAGTATRSSRDRPSTSAIRHTREPISSASRCVTMRLNASGSAISDQSRPISCSRARSRARACAFSRWRTVSSCSDLSRRNARTLRMSAVVSTGFCRKSSAPAS